MGVFIKSGGLLEYSHKGNEARTTRKSSAKKVLFLEFATTKSWRLLMSDLWDKDFETMSQTVIPFFRNVLGNDNEPYIKINDPNSNYPMLITSTNPITIRTCAKNSSCWCQFYYQFGHEMTHYAFRQHKKNKDSIIKWFEETVCEAMSLYIMHIISRHWTDNAFYSRDSKYNSSIDDYIYTELKRPGTDKLRQCTTLEQLREIENTSEENRADRYYERFCLYQLFLESPDKIYSIFYYTDFIQPDGLLIDFDKWIASFSDAKDFLETVKTIQPIIKE
jgi:hypothetical protein